MGSTPHLLAASCLLFAASPAAAAPEQSATAVYAVKKGDTLFDIAAQYLTTPGAAGLLQRLNHIADPRRMPVDLRLRVPVRLLRQEPIQARIHAFAGPVAIVVNGRTVPAAQGMTLSEGAAIQTGANAFVSLDLPDGTVVTMPSQSRAAIARLRRTLLTGSVDRRFDIAAGRVRAVVTPMTDPRSGFKVSTPVAMAAVRGTEFRVGYDPVGRRATTEVITGKVAVTDGKSAGALVTAGYGAAARPDGGVSPPTALLPAPEPANASGKQHDPTLSFAVKPVAGAVAYRLQIATDAGFLEAISETDSPQPVFTLPGLPDGTYFSRIAAIDANGLEGQSNVYGFERRLHAITASMEQGTSGNRREYRFRWRDLGKGAYAYRFQLARCVSDSRPVIDQANIADFGLVVTDLPPGDYCWRVQSIALDSAADNVIWSDAQKFTILR